MMKFIQITKTAISLMAYSKRVRILLMLCLCAFSSIEVFADELPKTRDIIIKNNDVRHHFSVEIADSPALREQGLMFRKSMDDDKGMLFLFEKSERIGMWMKNTLIPLDMLFIDESGKIIKIAEEAEPESLEVIDSVKKASKVLELNGGITKKLSIKAGDVMIVCDTGNVDCEK